MPIGWALAGSAVAGLLGSNMQANAASSAAQKQSDAAKYAADLQQQQFNQIQQQQAPYRQAGYTALDQITGMMPALTQQAPAYKPFTAEDLKSNLAPNYEFMLNQGLGANKQALNVGGGGSNISRGATKFAEDYASNAYQNALINYMTQQQQGFNQSQTSTGNIFNRLAAIAGIGQAGQNQVNQAGLSTAGNIGSAGIAGAGYQAAGQVAGANAYGGALSNLGNAGMLYGLLNKPGAAGSIGTVGNTAGYYDPSQVEF
jgi:hypothetical protein